jgi:hypothetical protein
MDVIVGCTCNRVSKDMVARNSDHLLSRKSGLGLRLNLDLILIHWSNT